MEAAGLVLCQALLVRLKMRKKNDSTASGKEKQEAIRKEKDELRFRASCDNVD
ncbi:hypothetical protein HPP92_028782 [Vanilla planifolia]|uniref:Uncharacterized protein n=1 Tax=Vanilla planifolia TaxID=51239 RepID=A0A835U2K6_VANPL|nr:hypothetical protein HPP92_028782 [Vanilla planifolia]KAG0446571.1 hypothetical protein HPP92_028771 [Vanilla planifolia]